tara:strand:- start:200856 stop:201641 length:786 start_codon:yes stop_codon:yes gene_type:complete
VFITALTKNYKKMTKKQQVKFGAISGLILIAIYLFLSLEKFKCPTENQYLALKVLIALGAASFATIIPGFIEVRYRNLITASGAIAVFVIVLIINPKPISSYTGCNESTNITGNIFLDDRPFAMAEVYLIELNSPKIYSNDNGHFDYQYNESLNFDTLTIRIKSDALKIDTSIISVDHNRFLRFRLSSKTNNISTVNPNTSNSNSSQLREFCIECTAKDSLERVVNFKEKCDSDSLFLTNYISGFTKASVEQDRTVNCIWK